MNTQSEVDEVLARLGRVQPPAGLERRINLRLQTPQPRFSGRRLPVSRLLGPISIHRSIAACALAASLAVGAVALHPALRHLSFHHSTSQGTQAVRVPVQAPRALAPAPGGFGTASEIHVPAQPVPVQPTPVNQGRGRSRTGRSTLPAGGLAPLPRGVAPALPETHPTAPPQ